MQKENKRKDGKRGKKISSVILSVVLAVSVFTGCGSKKEEKDILQEPQKGRYVEEEMTLPDEWGEGQIRQIFRLNDELHLLLQSNEDSNTRLQEWMLNKDGNFVDVTREWLGKLSFPYEGYEKLKLMQDAKGVQYLYTCYAEEGFYKGHLWRSEGNEAKDITPEKWSVMDEQYGFYDYPDDIALTEAGTLVSYSFLAMDTVLAEDGSLVSTTEPENFYGEWIAAVGENIYQYTMDDTGSVNALEIRKHSQDAEPESIPFSQEKSSYVNFDILEDGTVIAADADGFFRCAAGDSNWEKIIAGADTSFVLTNVWCEGIVALPDGTYYAFFGSDEGKKLMQYHYDPEAAIEVTETLTLYTVQESYLLQQAAALYHKKHPEVLIEIETGFSKMESYRAQPDYQQIYQELNTSLMAGTGPDILIMDGLNMEAYASKGLLTDIEDVVAPLEENGSLLENITRGYRTEDGNRYAVPLQFGLVLAIGRDIGEDEMESLDSLANALLQKEESYMGPQTVPELVDKFYPFFTEEIVQDKQLQREKLAVRLEQMKKIADNCGILENREEDTWCYRIWDIAFRSKLALYETEGFNNAMMPISAANYIKGSYTCLEQSYYPVLEIGINSKSEYQNTAKDFLRFALSEEVQGNDYYEGFPVNAISLEMLAAADRSNAEAYTTIEIGEGVEEVFAIESFSEADSRKLVEMCKSVSVRAKEDAQIRAVLIDTLPAYLNGSKSPDETLDAIEGGLKMYLAE